MGIETGMARSVNRVALVTGASSGMGAAICKDSAKYGMTVIGCARNMDAIQTLANECVKENYSGKLIPVKCDVSKENEIHGMFDFIAKNYNGVDVCINNAGFSTPEPLLQLTAEKMRAMLDVNVVGLVLCSSKAANSMLARKVSDGHIILINRHCCDHNFLSMSGHRLTGKLNFYTATKFAVTAITEGLRKELLEKTRIRVRAVSPGLTHTEFAPRAWKEGGLEWFGSRIQNNTILKAQDVSDAVIFALSAPENSHVYDILMRPTGDHLS